MMPWSSPYPILGYKPIDKWEVHELIQELKSRGVSVLADKEELVRRLAQDLNRAEQEQSHARDVACHGSSALVEIDVKERVVPPSANEPTKLLGTERMKVAGLDSSVETTFPTSPLKQVPPPEEQSDVRDVACHGSSALVEIDVKAQPTEDGQPKERVVAPSANEPTMLLGTEWMKVGFPTRPLKRLPPPEDFCLPRGFQSSLWDYDIFGPKDSPRHLLAQESSCAEQEKSDDTVAADDDRHHQYYSIEVRMEKSLP